MADDDDIECKEKEIERVKGKKQLIIAVEAGKDIPKDEFGQTAVALRIVKRLPDGRFATVPVYPQFSYVY